jgi:hypothetical protein
MRCAERGTHNDLEHLVVAVFRLEAVDVVIRHLVGVLVNFVDQRLEIAGKSASLSGGASDRRIALAFALKGALENSVAEFRVRVNRHAGNVRREFPRRNVIARSLLGLSNAGGLRRIKGENHGSEALGNPGRDVAGEFQRITSYLACHPLRHDCWIIARKSFSAPSVALCTVAASPASTPFCPALW